MNKTIENKSYDNEVKGEQVTVTPEIKQELQQKISGLRCSFNEVNKALEWGGLEESYPLASKVFHYIEEIENYINSLP
ncbi:MAG: hypothetical protein LBS20_11650 [Prevotella sp.]|jgi:hypothetical protein|nr:hypothetical protein [Prevotella sp.]